MNEDIKQLWQEIISHQLKGIMFHSDAMAQYALFKDFKRMQAKHFKQLNEEMANYEVTIMMVIDKYHEIIEASPQLDKVIIEGAVTTRPLSKLERESISDKITQMWHKWESETVNLYEKALTHIPDCTLLKKLKKDAEKELSYINKLL